jgi:hypothetical protein
MLSIQLLGPKSLVVSSVDRIKQIKILVVYEHKTQNNSPPIYENSTDIEQCESQSSVMAVADSAVGLCGGSKGKFPAHFAEIIDPPLDGLFGAILRFTCRLD